MSTEQTGRPTEKEWSSATLRGLRMTRYGPRFSPDDAVAALRPLIAREREDARAEALAEAWAEGYDAGHEDARGVQSAYPDFTPNPYTQPAQTQNGDT